jgi:serine phosphatase RsbU (regulator of sigma subunit)
MALSQSLDRNVFITAVYAILDTAREELVLARAGHCPVALIPLSGEARYIRTAGLGLGLDRSKHFGARLTEDVLPLQPGDVFVLYTDGVVESRGTSGEEYGYERLLKILSDHRHEDAGDLHDIVLRDLRLFLGSNEYDDDLTLLVLKWHGLPVNAARHSTFAVEESS